jgi:hypothetical protein
MKNLLVALVGVVFLSNSAGIVGQSQGGSLQGVWQTVEVTIAGAAPRTIAIPRPAPWLTIITARHYSRTEVQAEGLPRPILADVAKATADELRAVWGPFVAEAGTYEVSGNIVTMHPMASKNPAAMAPGAFIVSSYKLDGDTLWLAQQRNQSGPYPSPVTFKLVRVE